MRLAFLSALKHFTFLFMLLFFQYPFTLNASIRRLCLNAFWVKTPDITRLGTRWGNEHVLCSVVSVFLIVKRKMIRELRKQERNKFEGVYLPQGLAAAAESGDIALYPESMTHKQQWQFTSKI